MIDFFFDIDGTLLPFGKSVPESTIEAIKKLQRMGHRAFLATGRSLAEVGDNIKSIGFDGGVFVSGATVYVGDKLVYHRSFTDEEKNKVLSYCSEKGFYTLVQSENGTYLSQTSLDYWKALLLKYVGRMVSVAGLIISDDLPDDISVNKILYVTPSMKIEKVRRDLSPSFHVVDNTVGLPADLMGEIVLSDVTKASGIDIVESFLPTRSFVVAVGDGANDIEMLESADLGIAMGNATENLKNVADFVTKNVDDNGLASAVDYAIALYERN